MSEVQKLISVIWTDVPERDVVVMTFLDAARGPVAIEELDGEYETWNEMEADVFSAAEEYCRERNAILDQSTYFRNLDERFSVEPQQKERT